ncbi:peptidylprolyl isomerase [Neotabrizicola sp. VNH66]|uniref:peptidylprolyl isomerase n=1 Tax=Neotabrizicola sp. VNH66 TaxID=3400918 RepID=UPI003C0D80A0
MADDEPKRKPKRGQQAAGWLLTGMLILGLGGFGITNFQSSVSSVGSVGDVTISTKDYAREVQSQTASLSQQFGMQLGVQQALQFGIGQQALSSLVSRAALDDRAAKIGLSVGDQTVAAEIMKQSAFSGVTGAFDRDTYRRALQQNGWTDAEYEESLRRDVARSLLQGAVAGGFTAPASVTDAMYRYIAERRGFSMIRVTAADLTAPVAEPTEEELRAWYDANIAAFTRPEAKRIAYAALLPETIAKDQPVDEALLSKMYDERISEFVVPERRLVERLVFPDQAALDAAKAALDAGTTTFEALVTDRGLTMDAVDMGDVALTDLGAAGEAVFAAAEGSTVAAESSLGPALFRVNGTLAGEEVSFDEAKADLAQELQFDAARRLIADKVEEIDDLLAGGETLETLAKSVGMTLASVDYAAGAQGPDAIEGYQAFRDAADKLAEGDFPEAVLLDDGGVVAMEFVETVPAAPIPFDEAREAVTEAWTAAATRKARSDQAVAFKSAVEGGATLGSLGIVDVTPAISREGTVDNTPASLMTTVFTMAEGEVRVFEDGEFIALVRLDSITPADETGAEAEALKAAIAAQVQQALSQDAFAAFATAVSDSAGIQIDQNAINAVNAQLQ